MRFLMRHQRPPQEAITEFAGQIGESELIAELLLQRGIDSAEKARDFFASDQLIDPFAFECMEETVALIQKAEMEGECILASGDLAFLARSKGLAPGLTTFYIGGTWDEGLLKLGWVDGYSLPLSALSSRTAAEIHGAGKELWVWTVNTRPEAERAMELGADALVTDDPGLPLRDGGHLGQRAIW